MKKAKIFMCEYWAGTLIEDEEGFHSESFLTEEYKENYYKMIVKKFKQLNIN